LSDLLLAAWQLAGGLSLTLWDFSAFLPTANGI